MKEKILLISPSYGSKEINYFPLGLGYVAGACNRYGIDVGFFDMNIHGGVEQAVETVKKNDFHLVGIGGFLTQIKSTLELTAAIKKNSKNTTVIIGGVQVIGCENFIMENSAADIVCIGESEAILPKIVHALHANGDISRVPSLLYRENGSVIATEGQSIVEDIDEIAFPLYRVFPMEQYIKGNYHAAPGRRTIDFICSRGCPFRCNYCINSKKRAKPRYRSPENIVKEIRMLKAEYAINDFSFGDEVFTINAKKSLEICEALKGENITWVTSVRADGITDTILTAMKEAGCRMVLVGFESGSEKILKSMDKRTSLSTYSEAIRLLRKHDMPFYSNFMIGMPGESDETVRETEAFCKENGLIFGPSYVTPFPGTKLYDTVKGKIVDETGYLLRLGSMNFSKEPIINLTDMPDRKLISLRNRTVVNTASYLIKKKATMIPLFVIRSLGWVYLSVFTIKSPLISKIVRLMTKVMYTIISPRAPREGKSGRVKT